MTTCAIRYRFDGPGPASFIVQCGDDLRVYCRGVLSGPISESRAAAMLIGPCSRWVAACGEVMLQIDSGDGPSFPTLVLPIAADPATESA